MAPANPGSQPEGHLSGYQDLVLYDIVGTWMIFESLPLQRSTLWIRDGHMPMR